MDNFKKCSKCGEVKLSDCFSRGKSNKDGYRVWCKKCSAEEKKIYRAENSEKIKIADAKYRAKNPEKIKVTRDKHYAKNREKIIAKSIEYRTKNPEKVKANEVKWRTENPEKVKAMENRYAKEITDSYIKKQIKRRIGINNAHITQELIETKRLHILIQRKLKDLTK
jgi:hypothetical protein